MHLAALFKIFFPDHHPDNESFVRGDSSAGVSREAQEERRDALRDERANRLDDREQGGLLGQSQVHRHQSPEDIARGKTQNSVADRTA